MTKIKKTITLFLAAVIMITSVFGSSITVYAGGTEEEDTTTDSEISSVTSDYELDSDGYYPASLEWVLLNKFELSITFEDGSSTSLKYWNYNEYDECYSKYDSTGTYYMHFYNASGEKVTLTNEEVPIGEYTMSILRWMDGVESPIYEDTIKIISPIISESEGNTAEFKSEDTSKFEETWYPVSADAGKEYVFNASDWSDCYYFVSMWTLEDGVAKRIEEGFEGDTAYYYGTTSFLHTFSSEDPDLYVAIGETYPSYNNSGTVTWSEKKEISSLSIGGASSYNAWDGDMKNIPVTVTYTDNSSETITDWVSSSSLKYEDEDGEEQYIWVDSFKVTTDNGDILYLGAKKDGTWVDLYGTSAWASGKVTLAAFFETDFANCVEKTVTINEVEATAFSLDDGCYTSFSITSDKPGFYTCTTSELSGSYAETLQITNDSTYGMSVYVYCYDETDGLWHNRMSSSVSAGFLDTYKYTYENTEYLLILRTENSNVGTLGKYIKGTAVSASVDVTEVDGSDYTVWADLPISINYVSAEDSSISLPGQTVRSWYANNGGTAYCRNRYYENIYYGLYNGSTLVEIPVVSDEYVAEFGNDEEAIAEFIRDYYGIESLEVEAGTYTLKVYLGSIEDANVIGTSELTVVNSSMCTDHTWDAGTVTKAATCTAKGTKTYTCTNCGETKTETIAKISTVKLSYTKTTYSGSKKTPTVTVTDAEGNMLTKGTDYTVSFVSSTRKNVGRYTVKVTFKGDYSGSKKLYFTIVPKAPETAEAELYGYNDVKFSWSKSTGASGYYVYYKKATASSYTYLGATTGTSYKKADLSSGVKYTFKVVPYYETSGGTKYAAITSKTANVTTLKKMSAPTVAKASDTTVKVSWTNIAGETGYQISRSTSKTKTNIVATYKTTSGTSKVITPKKQNTTYYYKVRAYKTVGDTKIYGPWSDVTAYNLRYVNPVTDVKAVLYGYDDVKVTWTKAVGANAYAVYYKKSTASSYTYYKTVTGTTCKKADLADGVKYTFKVVPQYKVDGTVKLKGTADTATVTSLKKLSAPTVTKYSSTKVKVKWTNIAGETGYQISRSTSKTGTNIVSTYATTSGTYKTITPPKTNTSYYYKVRAYKTVDGTKIFGPWSAVKAYNLK